MLDIEECSALMKPMQQHLKMRNQKDTFDVINGGKPNQDSKLMAATQICSKSPKFKTTKFWYGFHTRAISIARQLTLDSLSGYDDLDIDFDQLLYARNASKTPWAQIEIFSPPLPIKLETQCINIYIALADHKKGEACLRMIPQPPMERGLKAHRKTVKETNRYGIQLDMGTVNEKNQIALNLKKGQIVIFDSVIPWRFETNVDEYKLWGYSMTYRTTSTIKYSRQYGVAHSETDSIDWYRS